MIFDELRIPRLDWKKERKDFVSIIIIIFCCCGRIVLLFSHVRQSIASF